MGAVLGLAGRHRANDKTVPLASSEAVVGKRAVTGQHRQVQKGTHQPREEVEVSTVPFWTRVPSFIVRFCLGWTLTYPDSQVNHPLLCPLLIIHAV